MAKAIGMTLLVIAVSSFAFAGSTAPEINPGFAGSAFALVGGVSLIIRNRRRK